MKTKHILIILSFLLFIAITIHHYLICGRIFDLTDMLHHEFFSFILLAFAAGLGIGEVLE